MKIFKFIAVTFLFLIISVSLLISVLYFYKNKETKVITDAIRQKAGGQYVQLCKGLTHYQVAGPDSGKVVILIHGFSVPYFIWDGTFEYLAGKGYRVIRYDMYGRGFSDRPYTTYNNKLYMDQLAELIATLKLKTPVSLAGISFGGEIATDFACLHPEIISKIILLDPGFKTVRPTMPFFATLISEAITPDDRAMGQLSDFKYPKRYPDWVSKYKEQMQYKTFAGRLYPQLIIISTMARKVAPALMPPINLCC